VTKERKKERKKERESDDRQPKKGIIFFKKSFEQEVRRLEYWQGSHPNSSLCTDEPYYYYYYYYYY